MLSNLVAYCAQLLGLVAVASVLPPLLRVRVPGARYVYWRIVLAVALVLPWLQPRRVPTVSSSAVTSSAAIVDSQPIANAAAAGPSAPAADWSTLFLFAIASGVALRLIWMAIGFVRLQRLRRIGEPAPPEEHEAVQRAIRTRADVRYVPGTAQPITFGAWRPLVLLPEKLRAQPQEIREAVLAHELWHVRRRDWVWLLLEEVVRATFWFHPAMWWLVSQVQLTREEVVDSLAVSVTGRRRAYVEALVAFADDVPLAPATAFARRRHLFHRIVLISSEVPMSARRLVASCVVMASILAAGGSYVVGAFPLSGEPAQEILQQSPGPLERTAHSPSPANPVPRRIAYRAAEYPSEAAAAGAAVSVTMRTIIDAAGGVAEARVLRLVFRVPGATMSYNGRELPVQGDVMLGKEGGFEQFLAGLDRATVRRQPGTESTSVGTMARPTIEATIRAAVAALQQWRYEAPAHAPLGLDTTFHFTPGQPVVDTEAALAGPVPPPPPPPPPSTMVFVPKPPATTGGTPAPSAPAGAARPGDRVAPPPPPPPPPAPLRVGGNIGMPKKIKHVPPVYPPDAEAARVQGVVIIEATIDGAGRVSQARVLRSIPMLDQAALDAVRQWEFEPTLLNGVPVPVMMTMTVQFTMD